MKNIYKKHNSFSNFRLSKQKDNLDLKKIIKTLKILTNNEKKFSKKKYF